MISVLSDYYYEVRFSLTKDFYVSNNEIKKKYKLNINIYSKMLQYKGNTVGRDRKYNLFISFTGN